MKKAMILAGALCALGVLLVASAFALQDDNNGWFRQRAAGMFVHRIERQLNLSNAQRDQIRAILKTEQPRIESLAARLREEQKDLASHQGFDEAWVRAYARENASTAEDVLVEREKVRSEIMRVLTPEQRAKAEQIRNEVANQLSDRLTKIGDEL